MAGYEWPTCPFRVWYSSSRPTSCWLHSACCLAQPFGLETRKKKKQLLSISSSNQWFWRASNFSSQPETGPPTLSFLDTCSPIIFTSYNVEIACWKCLLKKPAFISCNNVCPHPTSISLLQRCVLLSGMCTLIKGKGKKSRSIPLAFMLSEIYGAEIVWHLLEFSLAHVQRECIKDMNDVCICMKIYRM